MVFTCFETIAIDPSTSLIFVSDSSQNLNIFSKKAFKIDSIKYLGCAEKYANATLIKAYRESLQRIRVSVIDQNSRIGIISVQF